MRIIKIQINEFGPLANRSFDFDDALTIIQGDNESGKSSLLLFIKFALYGLSKRAKGGAATEIERALCRDTSKASGYMIVSHEGGEYRIDRYIGKASRSFTERVQVTDLKTGEACDFGNSPGEFFLGIPAEIFENSCGISQLGCSTVKGEQLGEAIRNILSSADESIDYEKAVKTLDAARVKYLHKNKNAGTVYTLSKQVEELSAAYTRAVDDRCETERIEAELKRLDSTIAEVSEKQKLADELASKITLRSVVKLFDKLHEYEDEQKAATEELEDTNEKLSKNGVFIDRQYLAEISSATSELKIAHAEKVSKGIELEYVLSSCDKQTKDTLKRLEPWGSIDALRAFAKKTFASVKLKTTLSIASAILCALFVALPFTPAQLPVLPSFVIAAISAVLSIVFVVLIANTVKNAKKKCAELGTDYGELANFLKAAQEAAYTASEINAKAGEIRENLYIKERILALAIDKCTGIVNRYEPETDGELSFDLLCERLEKISLEATALCDKKDTLSARLSALSSNVAGLSAELSDYNEHQVRHKVSDKILSMTDAEIQTAKKEKSFHDLQLKALGEKKHNAERALLERKYTTDDPFDIAAKLAHTEEQLKIHSEHLAALILAIDTIEAASANLRSDIAPQIHSAANDYMSRLTDGKYTSVAVSDTLDMSMSEDGFSYSIDTFSTGTKDAAYLALRLSLLGLICPNEAPPLLMDETLAMIDDKRAKKILSMLSEHAKERGQCIIFCCHDREARLCRDESIEFSSITM